MPGLVAAMVGYPAAASVEATTSSMTGLAGQFEEFLDWFPGRYDSALQTRTDVLDDVPEGERNYRRHSIFRRVDLPAFGEVVFYAEQYRDGDPEQVYRQRVYVLTLDEEKQAIRLRVHVPEDVESLRGAYREPSRLEGLVPEMTTVWEGCDLWWKKEGERFRGALEPGACRFTSEAFGQEIVLEEYLLLGEDDIQFADRGLALDGRYLFGMRGDVPNISLAIRPFLCNVQHAGDASTHWIHDQGGGLPVGDETLVMQRWTAAGHDRALRLELVDTGGGIVASGWAAADAESITLTHDELAIECRHAPETLYDDGR